MRLDTRDLMAFAYCPFMYKEVGAGRLVPPLSLKEQILRESILGAEQRALDQDSYLTPRKIGNIWEKIWWPTAAKEGLDSRETENVSIKMSRKMVDYCKYDISGPGFETVGLDVKSEIKLDQCVVGTQIDIVKLPLFEKEKYITLIDFKRKNMNNLEVANDISVLANMYAFKDLGKPITYICVDLSEDLQKTKMSSTFYEQEDLEKVGKTLNYIANGIYKGIDYQYIWMCDRCNKCRKK